MRDRDRHTSIDCVKEPAGWPYLTDRLSGIGGELKKRPEDFQVEEMPAYHPSGQGEHLFLWIEKRDVSAEQLLRHVATSLGISRTEVGTAGMKDRRALTRQYVSVPARCAGRLDTLQTESIRVLEECRHGNKLKTGHLRGNRFSILLRSVDRSALQPAEAVARIVQRFGFPNYFGAQRFGRNGETLAIGLKLLRGQTAPADLPRSRRKFLIRLGLSAAQADLFNGCLAERLGDGLFGRVVAGDVMQVAASGGTFVAEDVETEQQRADGGQIAVTGPIFGPKMKQPKGEPAEREERILQEAQLAIDSFAAFRRVARGTRRAYAVRPGKIGIEPEEDGLRFQFTLPPGTYATSLLREFTKVG